MRAGPAWSQNSVSGPGSGLTRLIWTLQPGWPGWKCFNCARLRGRLAASMAVTCLICFSISKYTISCISKVSWVDKTMTRGTIEINSCDTTFVRCLHLFRISKLGQNFSYEHMSGLAKPAGPVKWAHMNRPLLCTMHVRQAMAKKKPFWVIHNYLSFLCYKHRGRNQFYLLFRSASCFEQKSNQWPPATVVQKLSWLTKCPYMIMTIAVSWS